MKKLARANGLVYQATKQLHDGNSHPSFRPSHVRYAYSVGPQDAVVEVTSRIPHMPEGPAEYGCGKVDTGLRSIVQHNRSNNALGHGMYVDRIRFVVEISNRPVL